MEDNSSKEQLGVKHDPGHGAASGWEFSSLILMTNFGFIALRTRASLCWAAVPGCIVHLPCSWRAGLQIRKRKKDLEDQKLRSNFLPCARKNSHGLKFPKPDRKTERNCSSAGWLDLSSQPCPHGQKMLGTPRKMSPSSIINDVVFNLKALMLIFLLGLGVP